MLRKKPPIQPGSVTEGGCRNDIDIVAFTPFHDQAVPALFLEIGGCKFVPAGRSHIDLNLSGDGAGRDLIQIRNPVLEPPRLALRPSFDHDTTYETPEHRTLHSL